MPRTPPHAAAALGFRWRLAHQPGVRIVLALVLSLGLASCAGRQPAPRPAQPPAPSTQSVPPQPAPKPTQPPTPTLAADSPLQRSGWTAISGWPGPGLDEARAAFAKSCPALARRDDSSGLTRREDWAAACAAAARPGDAQAFFEAAFVPVTVAGGHGYTTGYFELELAGSREPSAAFPYPLYRPPADLIEADLGQFADSLKGRTIRGRIEGRRLVPYYDRAAIAAGALKGRGLELAWAADPYELFMLEVQGSGRLRLPDGSTMRIGFAAQNGRDYVAIGRALRDRGAFEKGAASMENITAWLRAHPDEARGVMNLNPSYVFFRELTGDGPVGALGVALTPERSVAADPRFVPLGAPVWVATDTAEGPFARLMVAQDTGGAIKGANRFDLFFGYGPRARGLANVQANAASAVILLPRAAADRISAPGADGARP